MGYLDKRTLHKALTILCLFVAATDLWSQGVADFPFRRDSVLSFPTIQNLTLDEVYAVVNANHPKLSESRLGIRGAQAQILRAWGTLDPKAEVQTGAKNEFEKFKQQTLDAQVTTPLYWGQKIVAGWKRNLGLFDQDAATPLSGEAYFGVSIPLWRNILIDKNRSQIIKSEIQPGIAEQEIIAVRNDLFVKAAEKYWDWTGNFQKLIINKKLLDIAIVRSNGIQQEIIRGERAPIDSVEIFQEVQRRKGALIKARRMYEKSTIALSVLLWNADGKPEDIPANVVPLNFPQIVRLTSEQYTTDKTAALTKRPELALNRAERRIADVSRDLANEQWKPDVNLKLQPFTRQLAEGISRFDYKVGIEFETPLLWRDARGQLQEAEIKQQSIDFKLLTLEREIFAQIDDAASEALATFEQYETARLERIAAEQLEQSERDLFANGESDVFRVNFRERFTGQAAEKEVDALSAYFQAIAQYRWATAQY